MSSLCTLIVACGWMLPREVEMVFDGTGLSGEVKCKGLDSARYNNLPFYFFISCSLFV